LWNAAPLSTDATAIFAPAKKSTFAQPARASLRASQTKQTAQGFRMPDPDFQLLRLLLCVAMGLLALLLLLGWRMAGRLARIERQLTELAHRPDSENSPPSQAETQTGGAFETFLSEEPARRLLTKSEQFAAYRQWRQEKGLNWSAPS
jgi:hypothetical protein